MPYGAHCQLCYDPSCRSTRTAVLRAWLRVMGDRTVGCPRRSQGPPLDLRWSRWDSNPRPPRCERGAHSPELRPQAMGDRLSITVSPNRTGFITLVETRGLEPRFLRCERSVLPLYDDPMTFVEVSRDAPLGSEPSAHDFTKVVGMAGIEPATASPPDSWPTTGRHPDKHAVSRRSGPFTTRSAARAYPQRRESRCLPVHTRLACTGNPCPSVRDAG